MRAIAALGAATGLLAGCSGGTAGNSARAGAPANEAAPAPERPPNLALDQQRLVQACIPAAERETPIGRLTPTRRAALNLCLNTETTRQLQPRLPIRIDSRTQLDRVAVEGRALVYRYRIAMPVAALPAGIGDRLESNTRGAACRGEDVRQIIALGGVQVYRWVDRDEAAIREVRVETCPEETGAARR